MRRSIFALAASALMALSACGAPAALPDGDNPGGNVLSYADRIRDHDGPVRIRGECNSACTMWTGHPQACVERPASLGFHAVARDLTGIAQRIYEDHLPTRGEDGGLRAWYRANADESSKLTYLNARTLIERGWVRECEPLDSGPPRALVVGT